MGKFIISKRKNGEFQFNLKANNGQVILTSQGYKSKPSCMNGVESVQKNSSDMAHFEKKKAANGKIFFNLKSTNGQVIGSSQMYSNDSSCSKGIRSVQNNAPDAIIDDQSV